MPSSQISDFVTSLTAITSQDYAELPRLAEMAKNLAVSYLHTEYEILFGLHIEGSRDHVVGDGFKSRYNTLELPAFNPFLEFINDRTISENVLQLSSIAELVHISEGISEIRTLEAAQMRDDLGRIYSRLVTQLHRYKTFIEDVETTSHTPTSSDVLGMEGLRILIGHGRSDVWESLRDYLEQDLHLEHEEFDRVSTAGHPTTTRLGHMLENSRFAFLVLTAEDEHADGSIYPRGNVLHELGLAQGRYGFTKAIVLLEKGCDEISNIEGLSQIRFPRGDILAEDPKKKIMMVLIREGIIRED